MHLLLCINIFLLFDNLAFTRNININDNLLSEMTRIFGILVLRPSSLLNRFKYVKYLNIDLFLNSDDSSL